MNPGLRVRPSTLWLIWTHAPGRLALGGKRRVSGRPTDNIRGRPFRCQRLLNHIQRRFHISDMADLRQNLRATAVAQRE